MIIAVLWALQTWEVLYPCLYAVNCILVILKLMQYKIMEWADMQEAAPQNLIVDEHYLCTVAAGGHRRIVKPLRMGERHGHAVIVNRQLMIASAFEQLLEERTPRYHRHVRHFYDTYGFPVAKLIHSRTAANVVYFMMKPLELIFLITLYLFDVKPENRIAVQYLPL